MIHLARSLSLTREQASRLQGYLQTYRRYAFASLLPSVQRNTTLRQLQVLQGKLIAAMDQRTTMVLLRITVEELATLQTITAELLVLYAQQPENAERTAILGDLAALKVSLKAQ